MQALKSIIVDQSIELIIWDFDLVIFTLDWGYQSTPGELLERLYEEINGVDPTVIKDKEEFVARLYPYPEINEIGLRHGKQAQTGAKELFRQKEAAALHRAVPNQEVIDFIRDTDLPQAVWSNNWASTIEPLLEQAGIADKIDPISSLDKVVESKPQVEGFEIIREKYPDIENDNILMIGDSLRSDKVAAERVGIRFWHYV